MIFFLLKPLSVGMRTPQMRGSHRLRNWQDNMLRFNTRIFCALLLAGAVFAVRADMATQVRLDFFFTPGCSECERVKREVFPELESRFEGFYELVSHDMSKSETIPLLVAYQERCGNNDNGRVSLVVDHTAFLSGIDTVSTGLFDRVNEALVARQNPQWAPPRPPSVAGEKGAAVVRNHAHDFTFAVVALGGLVDGFNPCAISTLIFFMSILAVAKVARGTRLLVGLSFIASSFVVYTALGLGFLFAFRHAPNFPLVKKTIEVLLGLCMVPLAAFSFRDAFRFSKSQRPDDVTLQIPKKVKDQIHAFMNSRLGVGGPIIGGLVTGAGVTILESVCTGQSYVPTLMYILKTDSTNFLVWSLLLTYNLLFILPLSAVFLCFHRGMQLKSLITWSKENLVIAKVLLGLFFTVMAILLLWPKSLHP